MKEDADYWNNRGIALFNSGKYDEAIECYDKAIKINPNNSVAWKNQGMALSILKRTKEAQKCFNKAKEINQQNNK